MSRDEKLPNVAGAAAGVAAIQVQQAIDGAKVVTILALLGD